MCPYIYVGLCVCACLYLCICIFCWFAKFSHSCILTPLHLSMSKDLKAGKMSRHLTSRGYLPDISIRELSSRQPMCAYLYLATTGLTKFCQHNMRYTDFQHNMRCVEDHYTWWMQALSAISVTPHSLPPSLKSISVLMWLEEPNNTVDVSLTTWRTSTFDQQCSGPSVWVCKFYGCEKLLLFAA